MNPHLLTDAFAADVARGLQQTPKQLPAQYLYDALGSSLFDAICRLPWYRITRGEARLLARYALPILDRAVAANGEATIIELGVGNGEKLATLVQALPPPSTASVHLVDISPAALDATEARLSQFPQVTVVRHQGTYEHGLESVARAAAGDERRLVLFLGSNIGNFDAAAARDLLGSIRRTLAPPDLLLLGADLIKPEPDLILAYDDPLGVTAAFNKNLLVRMNRELGADFDLAAFDHRAVWNARRSRVEMHLVSRERQQVVIRALDCRLQFDEGESIWTESSYKYTGSDLVELGASTGFSTVEQWVEAEARFALTLFHANS